MAVAAAVKPVQQWATALKDDLAPQLESVRSLKKLTERVRPIVRIVDDDALQHKRLQKMLADAGIEAMFAVTVMDGFAILNTTTRLKHVDALGVTLSGFRCNRFVVFASSAIRLLPTQFLMCCIQRLNPQSNAALDTTFNIAPLGQAGGANGSFRAGFSFPMKKPAVSDSGPWALECFAAWAVCQAASFGRICRL